MHTANRVGNQLVVIGGTTTNEAKESDLHILNMDDMQWSAPDVFGPGIGITGHTTVSWDQHLYSMFGSEGNSMTNNVYALDTTSLDWQRLPTTGRVPCPRTYHSAVVADGVVYVFGGYDGRFYLNDLHSWRADPSPNGTSLWSKLEQKGSVPEVRASAATAVYGRSMYLFGGFEVAVYKNDFFVLNLDTLVWSPVSLGNLSCPMPSARAMASLTLVGSRLVLFGGVYCGSEGTCVELNDVHQFDVFKSEMVSKQPEGGTLPPARYGHSGTLFGSKVVVFGGTAWPNLFNDLWTYDVYDNVWSMGDGLAPYPRKQHSLDVYVNEDLQPALVSFGGRHGSGGYSNNLHLFNFDTSSWKHPDADGVVPPKTGHHASAIKDNSTLYVFGGYNGTHSNNDVFMCDLLTLSWEKMDVDGETPPPTHGHAIVSTGTHWLQFGGVDCDGDQCTFYNDMHSLAQEALSWFKIKVGGDMPRPRASHTWVTLSPTSHYLFGGIGALFTNLNDLFQYDEPTSMWRYVDTVGTRPMARFGHTATSYGGKMLIFGGANCRAVGECSYLNDVFMFIPSTRTWTEISIQGMAPAPRVGSAAVQLGETMYVLGGASDKRIFGELITVQPSSSVPERSIVLGGGVEVGVVGSAVRFEVQLQDEYGVNRTSGGDDVSVSLFPTTRKAMTKLKGESIKVFIVDGENGRYSVSYNTTVADTYNVTVTVNGEALPIFQTLVGPSLASPNTSLVKGTGLKTCVAGERCKFSVEKFDEFGNKLVRKSMIDVSFDGPKRVLKKIKDTGDGILRVEYTPEKAGKYQIHTDIRLEPIVGSPFTLDVRPGPSSPERSQISGPGVQTAEAGRLGEFQLQLYDIHDNPLAKGGDTVKAELIGPDELACSVKDHSNGTYSLSYTAVKTGSYQLNVVLNDEPVEGSPFDVLVTNAPISSATTFAYGSGMRNAVAGYRSYFTIQAADDFGNNMTRGGAQLNVIFAGPGTEKQVCNITDHGDGKYSVSYVTNTAGDFMISATLWNPSIGFQAIHLSPFMGSTIAGGTDPSKSYLYREDKDLPLGSAEQGVKMDAVMGVHGYFNVQAVDRFGNKKEVGGEKFTAELVGPVNHDGFVGDRGDGTYIGSYVAPAPGMYHLKVFYGGVMVSGTPIPVFVRSNFESCPNMCNGRGKCVSDECICHPGYAGHDCSVETANCPANCLGNGACLNNTCFCYPGFAGASCEQVTTLCINDCSKHGECVDAMCVCDEGYEGEDCADNTATCLDGCYGNGECVNGTCLCYPGFKGLNCGIKSRFCPKGCSGRGKCQTSGMCSCNMGWTGLDCANKILDLTDPLMNIHKTTATKAAATTAHTTEQVKETTETPKQVMEKRETPKAKSATPQALTPVSEGLPARLTRAKHS